MALRVHTPYALYRTINKGFIIEYQCPKCNQSRTLKKEPRGNTLCRKCARLEQLKDHKYKEYFRICKKCGDKKEVNSLQEIVPLCRDCFNHRESPGFPRTCVDCKEIKIMKTGSDAKAKRCKTCSVKHNSKKRIGTKSSKPKKRYYYFCVDCNSTKIKISKQRRVRCNKCNQTAYKEGHPYVYINLTTLEYRMRCIFCEQDVKLKNKSLKCTNCNKDNLYIVPLKYYAICTDCPIESQTRRATSKKTAGYSKCKKHKPVELMKPAIIKPMLPKKVKKPKIKHSKKNVSQEAILRARLLNEEHRAAQAEKKTIPKPKLTNEEMKALWLTTHKVTTLGTTAHNDYSLGYMVDKQSHTGTFL